MIVSQSEISHIINKLRREGKKIVFTNGCFDIIHRGHVEYLYQARKFGDVLIVGLNSDDSIYRIKGEGRPINSQEDREIVLDALKPVDYVVVFDDDTPLKLIKLILPDVLVKGSDWKPEEIVGAEIVKMNDGEVKTVAVVPGKSTTVLISKILRIYKNCKI
ncbi:MAG: D-glycero-beta-D-manno-heptose 1-phosphate adenylyltransferase [Candidatus Cloacimonadia bacterium]